jgi:predicted ATPase
MITSITLRNFRAFQDEVTIRLRPVTVLIGKNSAGKSSVIKFLLMVKQTLDSQATRFFNTEGKEVQLGTWKDVRHTNTRHAPFRDKYFQYSIRVETEDLPSAEMQQMWKIMSESGAVTTQGDRVRIHLEFSRPPLRKESPRGQFVIEGRVSYGERTKAGRHDVTGFLGESTIFHKSTRNLETSGFLRFSRRSDSVTEMLQAATGEPFLEALRYQFLSQRHLSPIREESQQVVQTGSPPPGFVGHKGEFAMPHLVRILADPEKRDKANFIAQFASQVAKVENLKFRSEVARLLTDVKGKNVDTGATCLLADFGFGVSQCLPIFIQGAMQDPRQLLIVEQPEAQLHPTAQLEMGSFFADLWVKHKVPSLIETHSGNILLRLRNLVKRGVLLPEDISIAYFTIEEVKRKGRPVFKAVVVKNLDINPDGTLAKGLPMEFFGADVLEALKMREKHAK